VIASGYEPVREAGPEGPVRKAGPEGLYSGSLLETTIYTHGCTEVLAVCANDHDGTCTAILSRSRTQPDWLVARLVCESCDEVVKILGFVEHTLGSVRALVSHDLHSVA
jgi:hypothetical protein